MYPHTHHTYRVFQLKDQAGALYRRDLLFILGMSLLFLPPWILLEFPQSHHPTTTTITVTFMPASRKPAPQSCHVFRANGHISLPPTWHSQSLYPSQGGASSGLGALRALCAGPQDPLPGCRRPGWPWSQAREPSCVFTQGLGKRRGGVGRSLITPLPGIPPGKGRGTPDPLSQPPLWESERRADARSLLLLQTGSRPLLPSCPPSGSPPATSPSVWGARSSQGAPTFFLLPSLMFTSNTNCPFRPSIRPGEFQLHHF